MSLNAALAALNRGFSVFPVAAGDKIPHRLAGKWGETATTDPSAVIGFWTQADPSANVGIACKPSQLLVVDLDVAKEPNKLAGTEWGYLHGAYGPMVSGRELFDEMVWKLADGVWPETYTVRTGSGGNHLYIWWPEHWPKISQASPAKGVIDVRGNGGQYGGYVLAEGSVTPAGRYTLEDPSPIVLAPEWLRSLVAEKPAQPRVHRVSGIRQPGAISWSGLVESVRWAGEGNRNNALVWAARTMCEEGGSEQDALDTLGPAAAEAGLPQHEIERTIQSAYRTQRYKEGS